MRGKSLALLLLALGCGLVASIGITQMISKRGTEPPPAETEQVVVAIQDIPLGEPITPLLVKLEQMPKNAIPAGALSKPEEYEGHRTRARIYKGEAILKFKLSGKGALETGVSPQIPIGMRVISVKVDVVSSSSGLILPGDRVDLLVNLQPNPVAGIREPTTRTVLQCIKVFAVNERVNLENIDNDAKSIKAQTISLLVTPDDAQKVKLACQLSNNDVSLVLRSPDDEKKTPDGPGASASSLFDTSPNGSQPAVGQPAVSPPAAAPPVVATAESREKTGEGGAFLQFVRENMGQKPETPAGGAAVEPAASHTQFVMCLISGTKREECVFEMTGDGADGKPGAWRPAVSADKPAAGPSLPAPVAAPPVERPNTPAVSPELQSTPQLKPNPHPQDPVKGASPPPKTT
jgi:pilus assembly protein CpaB